VPLKLFSKEIFDICLQLGPAALDRGRVQGRIQDKIKSVQPKEKTWSGLPVDNKLTILKKWPPIVFPTCNLTKDCKSSGRPRKITGSGTSMVSTVQMCQGSAQG
jgi:hypothetical protein